MKSVRSDAPAFPPLFEDVDAYMPGLNVSHLQRSERRRVLLTVQEACSDGSFVFIPLGLSQCAALGVVLVPVGQVMGGELADLLDNILVQ